MGTRCPAASAVYVPLDTHVRYVGTKYSHRAYHGTTYGYPLSGVFRRIRGKQNNAHAALTRQERDNRCIVNAAVEGSRPLSPVVIV